VLVVFELVSYEYGAFQAVPGLASTCVLKGNLASQPDARKPDADAWSASGGKGGTNCLCYTGINEFELSLVVKL